MDFKKVIKFNTLRAQLSTEEFTLAETLWDASDADKQLLVESLQPAAPTAVRKQQERCTHVYESGTVCAAASRNIVHHNSAHVDFHQFTTVKVKKSARAQKLGEAISTRTKERDEVLEPILCTKCNSTFGDNMHHLQTADGYHEFVAAETTAAGGD